MVRLLRAAAVPLVLVVLVGLSGAALGQIYAGPLLAQLILGAAVGSVAVSVAAHRLPSWLVAPLSVVSLAGYAAVALRLAAQRAELPGALGDVVGDAARNGIPRLLTALIPVEPVPDTVVVPLVAAWLAGLAGAELALRAGRVLLGYAPPVLLYAGALYVVGPNAAPAVWPTVGFAAAAVVGLTVTGRPGGATAGTAAGSQLTPGGQSVPGARAAAGTAAGVAVVVALAAVVAPVVAGWVGTTPVDPRRYVQPPRVDSLDENPLTRISGWALNPEQKLFDVTTSSGAAGAAPSPPPGGETSPAPAADAAGLRIRLAVLNDYDGVTWRVGATYRGAGRVLPPVAPLPGAAVDTVRQEITVGDLTGRLLPAVPTPQEVTGARVAYDPGSGTLIRPEGLVPGLRYTVTSVRERPDLNQLTAADVPSGAAVARVLRVGEGVPEQLSRLADELSSDNGAPYERAVAIEQFLAEHYRLVADAPSGHAYPNLTFFLFGPRNGGGQRGTTEQFAAAFAVLARLAGLPSRVVVGFRSGSRGGSVRAADAFAWPEALFDGLGWVAFDPLPQPDSEPRPVEEAFPPKPENPAPPPTEEPAPTTTPTASGAAPAAGAGPDGRGGTPVPVLAGGGIGGLLLLIGGLALTVIALRRTQQRRRLDEGSPEQRVAGAWLEVADALRLAGRPAAGHLAASEVAAHAMDVAAGAPAVRAPAPPIDDLASLVNLTTFAPGATSEEQARQAGADAVAYAAALRSGRPWLRRLLWSVHPGPLRRRR